LRIIERSFQYLELCSVEIKSGLGSTCNDKTGPNLRKSPDILRKIMNDRRTADDLYSETTGMRSSGGRYSIAKFDFICFICFSVTFTEDMKVTVKNVVFWDVTLCASCKNRRFGGT
jgi:hypothetical protein